MALADQLEALAHAFLVVHGRAPTQSELLVLAAHGMAESGLGTAGFREWPEGQAQPNERPEKGGPPLRTGTHNWGAVQYTGPRAGVTGYFSGLDHHANGSAYRGKFNIYLSAMDGAADFVRVATGTQRRRAEVLPTLATRNPRTYAYAQHATGYFELAPEKAAAGFLANAKSIASKMGWPPPAEGAPGWISSSAGVLPALAAAGFAVWFFASASTK